MKTYAALVMSLMLAGAPLAYATDDKDKGMSSETGKNMNSDKAEVQNKAASKQKGMKGSLETMSPDDLEGMDIHDSSGEQIGDIDEIVVDKAGEKMAVIGLKGDTKEVAVPLSKLKMSRDKEMLNLDMSRKQLMELPDYDPMDMESAEE